MQFEKDIGVTRALGMSGNMLKDRNIRIKRCGDDSKPPPDPKRRQQYVGIGTGDWDDCQSDSGTHKRPRGPD